MKSAVKTNASIFALALQELLQLKRILINILEVS
jgi:hypothetical protein